MSKQRSGLHSSQKNKIAIPATSARQSIRVNVPFLRDCTRGRRQPSVRKSMNTRFDRALSIRLTSRMTGRNWKMMVSHVASATHSFSVSYSPTHTPISAGVCMEFCKHYRADAVDLSVCIAPAKRGR